MVVDFKKYSIYTSLMFKLFKNFTKKDVLGILVATILIVAQVWLDLKAPDYMSAITQLVQTPGSEMSAILENGLYMMLCAFGSLALMIVVGYLAANISASLSRRIRKRLFDKVEELDIHDVKRFSTASLITRTTNDITQIQMLVSMGMQLLIKSPIMAVWAIAKIIGKSWEWSSLTGAAVVIVLSTVITIMVVVVPRFKIVQRLIDRLNRVTRENLSGIRVVRAFNAEGYQEKKFNEVNSDLTKIQLSNQRTFVIMQPLMYLVMYFMTLGIYYIGAHMINGAEMSEKLTLFSNMVVFSSYAMQVIMSFLMLAMIFMMIPRAEVSASRINEVLDTKNKIVSGTLKNQDANEKGVVEFKNVSFKYPDAEEYLLHNISFKADRGETVAFIGSTGSGKSTLINLVPRFYDVTEGEILIDGINVKDYKQTALRNIIGYVSQKAVMFAGTVRENVAYGNNGKAKPTLKEVKQAIKVAQGQDFVEKLDGEYEAHVAQGGTNLSGGQKQRLSIARAIARDPEIYIFDDSFSALDYKTDATLRKELKKHTKDATSLIVAQRIGTIMNADKIVVLDSGECVGIGTHKELLKNCDVYRQIALSQLSEEELNNA